MPRFGLYAALALCIYGLPASAEERFERWSLEQPGDFISRFHLNGQFRSMIGPQHRNSHFFVIKRKNMPLLCLCRSTARSKADRLRSPL